MRARVAEATVLTCLVLGSGCVGPGVTEEINVPLPGVGAKATYQVEASGRTWDKTFEIDGVHRFANADEAMRPGLWITETVNTSTGENHTGRKIFDLQARTWSVVDFNAVGYNQSGLLNLLNGNLGEIHFYSEYLALGSYYDPIPLSDLSGSTLRAGTAEETFTADFAGFGVSLQENEAKSPNSGYETDGPNSSHRTIRAAYVIQVKGNQAIVEASVTGMAVSATLTFEGGNPFPAQVVVHNSSSILLKYRLLSFAGGGEPVSFEKAPPSSWAQFEVEKMAHGVPPEGHGSRLAFPLHEAINSIESDLTLIAFHIWETSHPRKLLYYASLEPWRDQAGRTGLEWNVYFIAPNNDSAHLTSVRILEPPPFAGRIENRDSTAVDIFGPVNAYDFEVLESVEWVPVSHYIDIAAAVSGTSEPIHYATWGATEVSGGWTLEWNDVSFAGTNHFGFAADGQRPAIAQAILSYRETNPGILGTPLAWIGC